MKYVPCGSASFKATKYYCGYNERCFKIFKIDARLKETYDTRDGYTCSIEEAGCPC